jgi:foldase protein PrsA
MPRAMTKIRIPLALCAFFVVALMLSACGGGVPGDAVIKIGDSTIKKTTFNHWMQIAAISSAGQTNPNAKTKPQIPVPPDFKACIADKQKTAAKPAKGQPTPTAAQYKTQCKQQYEGLRDQVLQFLVSAEWIAGEAADRGVKVSDKEVQTQFQTTKKQSFPKQADFDKFLKNSGMQLSDLLYRVRLDALSTKLRASVTKGKNKVTDAQIAAYFKKNKSRFSQPERRDLRIVLTKTEAAANTALAALKSGQAFGAVAKKYSIDQASKAQGGALLAVAKGQEEKALDTAIFSASVGQLKGPIKTQFGYYVFKVQKITKASAQTLAQAKPTITQLLTSQNQQGALDKFVTGFRKKWKAKTECRKGFVTQDCKNAPKVKSATTTGAPAPVQSVPAQAPTRTTGG